MIIGGTAGTVVDLKTETWCPEDDEPRSDIARIETNMPSGPALRRHRDMVPDTESFLHGDKIPRYFFAREENALRNHQHRSRNPNLYRAPNEVDGKT